MGMKGEKGTVTGYEIDLVKAMAREAGLKVKIVERPWRKLLSELEKGRCDAVIASVGITPAKKERYDFSDPYFTARQLLVVRADRAMEPLDGRTLAAFRLSPQAENLRLYRRCSITYYTAQETEQAFKDLAGGTVDAILCDAPQAAYYTVAHPRYKGRLAALQTPLPQGCPEIAEEYGIVIKKGNRKLLDRINQGLKSVREKGIDRQLQAKWINEVQTRPAQEGLAEIKGPSSPQETP
jgi:polar amino acid transport system substrate-binding protein